MSAQGARTESPRKSLGIRDAESASNPCDRPVAEPGTVSPPIEAAGTCRAESEIWVLCWHKSPAPVDSGHSGAASIKRRQNSLSKLGFPTASGESPSRVTTSPKDGRT